jgi:acyl dehydratase
MTKLYWDTLEIGDPVTPLTKPPVTRVQIAKFAGAAQDYSPLHIDDDFAKSAGYGGVFAHGAITMGFATEAISKWAENGRVLAATATFQKLVWPGDILTAKGVVVNVYEKHGEHRADIDVWSENQNHDIVMKGQITVLLWQSEDEENAAKSIWPPVSPATREDRSAPPPPPPAEKPKKAASAKADEEEVETTAAAAKKTAKSASKKSSTQKKADAVDSAPASAKAATAKKSAAKKATKAPAAKKTSTAKKAAAKPAAKKTAAKKTSTAKKAAAKPAVKKAAVPKKAAAKKSP